MSWLEWLERNYRYNNIRLDKLEDLSDQIEDLCDQVEGLTRQIFNMKFA